MIASTGLSSVLGLVFWGLVARRYSPQALGKASAAVAAMSFLAVLAQFNLKNLYVRFLPRAGSATKRSVALGYLLSATAGIVFAIVFLGFDGAKSFLSSGFWPEALFVSGVVLSVIFVLQDGVMTSLRATIWLPVENASSSILKVVLVGFVVFSGSIGIFISWVISVAAAVVAVSLYLFLGAIPRHSRISSGEPEIPRGRALLNFVAGEYVASLANSALIFFVPILVLRMLDAKAEGYFILPWLIGWGIQTVLGSVSTAFVVDHGFAPQARGSSLVRSIIFSSLLLIPIALFALFAANPLLDLIYGAHYAPQGSMLLRLCVLANVFGALPVLYQTLAWVEGRVWEIAAVQGALAAISITTMVLLMRDQKIVAPGWGLLVAQCVVALLVAIPTRRKWLCFKESLKSSREHLPL